MPKTKHTFNVTTTYVLSDAWEQLGSYDRLVDAQAQVPGATWQPRGDKRWLVNDSQQHRIDAIPHHVHAQIMSLRAAGRKMTAALPTSRDAHYPNRADRLTKGALAAVLHDLPVESIKAKRNGTFEVRYLGRGAAYLAHAEWRQAVAWSLGLFKFDAKVDSRNEHYCGGTAFVATVREIV